MANNVDADTHIPVMDHDKQCENNLEIFENDESLDADDAEGFDIGDEFEVSMDGFEESGAGSQGGDNLEFEITNENVGDSNSVDKCIGEAETENTTSLISNNEATQEFEGTFEEIEEWEEVTEEEEVSDDEEVDENDEGDESDEDDEEDDGEEEDGAEEDASFDQSQLGACGHESDEDAEKCYICLVCFRDQDLGTPESCDHTFCLECILEWSKHVNTCPVDRTLFHSILVRSTVGGDIERSIEVATCNKQEEEDDSVTYCEVCGNCDREDRLLLCDGCDNGYHLECLDPPLDHVPIEEWYCPECVPKETTEQQEKSDISEKEEKPVVNQSERRDAAGTSQSRQRLARAIARTRVSERVVARISQARAQRLREQGSSESTAKRVRLPRVQMKKTRKKRRRKRKVKTKLKGKGTKKKSRKVKKKVKRLNPVTVKTRIAGKLGLVKARTGSLLPDRKVRLEPSLDNQRAGIGAAKLNMFGGNELTELSTNDGKQNVSRPNTSNLTIKSPGINASSSVDLLSSIMQGQELLHTKSENVTIHRDGTLSANLPVKESSPQKKQKLSTSSESPKLSPNKDNTRLSSKSSENLRDSYNVRLPPEKNEMETDNVYDNDENASENLFDNKQSKHEMLKGKRAAARELAKKRAAEKEEEVRNMKEQRKKEEEFNDEMEWDIQTPFSVGHKSKDDSKLKDSNINGTKNIEEEAQWVEVDHLQKNVEEEQVEKRDEKKEHKSSVSERDGKEPREGTLTCRASTSSFESHSETEEKNSRKSTDDKRKKSSRHKKSKRSRISNTSGSIHDSSAEEGEVKSDEDSRGLKSSKKKSKKSKRNYDRDTRNVVVNEYQKDLPKLKQDSRRVEDRDRYDRGNSYSDLRHVIQVKRNYDNPRYEMYWDEYNRKWVEYRPEWTSAWEQHRTYDQQMYAADWGRQNTGNAHRYLKERSWENFTVKRERSPIFDRRKSSGERDRRNRDTREKDKKEDRKDRKRYSQATTRSNSSGTDYSQRREKSRDRERDRKDKQKNETHNEKEHSRSGRPNGRDKHGKFNEIPEQQKTDRHKIKEPKKSKDLIKPENVVSSGKHSEKNERIKISTENRKPQERAKERIKENIEISAKSTKSDFLDKKKKKKEKPVKVKGKKEKKEKEKKTKKKKGETSNVKEIQRVEKREVVEKKDINREEREVATLKAQIDAIAFKKRTDEKPELKDIKLPPLQNIVQTSNEKVDNSPKRMPINSTELDKKTKEPVGAFEQTGKVDEPYDPFDPTASPSLSDSSPCSSFQTHSTPPPNSKRKLSSDLDSLNNSTDSAFGNTKRPKVETVKPPTETTVAKPVPKAFNDILPQLATQDGSKLNQLIDKFVNKSGKATLDSKETDAEKALPGSSKFATSAKKDFKSIFNAPSPNESDSEFEFNDEEEIESSAVELQNKNSRERYLKKLHHQERVVEEVKLAIKPYYQRKEIDKNDYKEILKRSVNQVCHSKSGEINPVKIRRLIDGYVKKFQLKKKHVDKSGKDKKKPTALTTEQVKKKR